MLLLSVGETAFAARVAGTDENMKASPASVSVPAPPAVQPEDTKKKETALPVGTTNEIIKATPAALGDAVKQDVPAAEINIPPGKGKDNLPLPETPGGKAIHAAEPFKEIKTKNVIEKLKQIPGEKLPAEPAKTAAAKEDRSKKYVTLDFDNVEISVLVKFVSEISGKNFIIDERVKGKVTVISPNKIALEDVYKVFLSVLEINGFTVVPSGDVIKIVPAITAREKNVETRFKKDRASPEDRVITQIVTLERANPEEIKHILDPIISKSSSVLAYAPAGILVITDYLSNINRLQEIIKALDVEGAGDQITYIPLQNASASEVVKALTAMFQQRRANATAIKVVPDSRTNSIIILASVSDTENVRKLVALMDKDLPRGESNIQVYRLQNSIAEDLAKVLTNIIKDTGATAGAASGAGGAAAQKAISPVVSKNVQIVADKATNTLVVMAEREDYKVIETIIKQLDVSRPMVYIEALIMEVNTNKAFNIGVEWRGLTDTGKVLGGQSVGFIGSGGAGTTTNPGGYNILGGLSTTTFPSGFSMGIIGAGINIGGILFPNIGAVIQAYKTDTDVSILSTPQIMTLDNEEAEINVGSNVPYITRQDSTATSGTVPVNYNSYEYKDVGVILNITPHINEEDFIRLKISQQVTKVTSASSSPTPTTLKRTAKTTVVVKDGETLVIGGLVGDSTTASTYKIPLLGDIPLLGWLFKSHSTAREKTNLYIFVTPRIIRTQKEAAKLSDKKREDMGEVVEGIIKLNEKSLNTQPSGASTPAANKTSAKP